jgi:hypothetical protein
MYSVISTPAMPADRGQRAKEQPLDGPWGTDEAVLFAG